MMSGAWLEANTPARLAMARPRRRVGPGGPHFFQEIGLGHAGDHKIKPEEVRVDPGCEERDVVALDRRPHLGLQGIAVEDILPVGAVFVAERSGALEIEEELAQPIVSHGRYFAMSADGCRSRRRNRADRYCFLPRSPVRGTNLTGRVRRVVVRPSDCFSTRRS